MCAQPAGNYGQLLQVIRDFIVLLIFISAVICYGQSKPESVCQVLADLPSHSNKVAKLSDKYAGDTFLGGGTCPKTIRIAGVEFENIVHIDWPGSPNVVANKLQVPFGLDTESGKALEHAIALWNKRSQDLWITLEGLLITRKPPLNLVVMRDPPQRMGFGPEGAGPIEVIIKRVIELKIVDRR